MREEHAGQELGAATCAALDVEGRRVVTGHSDGAVLIWDVDAGETEVHLAAHGAPVVSVAFAAGGRSVIAACGDRTVRSSAIDGNVSRVLAASPGGVMRFLNVIGQPRPGVALARSFDRHVLWVVALGTRRRWEIRDPDRRFSFALLLTDDTVLALSETGQLEYWTRAGHGARPVSVGVAVSAVTLAVAAPLVAVGDGAGQLHVWNFEDGTLRFVAAPHASRVCAIAFDESAQYLVSGAIDGTLSVIDTTTGSGIASWRATRAITCCAVTSRLVAADLGYRRHALTRSPLLIVVGSDDGLVHFIDCDGLTSPFDS